MKVSAVHQPLVIRFGVRNRTGSARPASLTDRRRAFTLVELLVTVAIILVLALIGFGVGRKVMAASRATLCMSNLRQCSPAVHLIKEEGLQNNGRTPPGFFPPYGGFLGAPSWRRFSIYDLIGEQAGYCVADGKKYKWSAHPAKTFLQNPLSEYKLADGLETGQIDMADISDKEIRKGGFGYNHHLNGWTDANSTEDNGHYKRTTLFKIRHPEWTVMMGEQQAADPSHIIGPYGQAPQGTYNDGAHVLFVDGHVEHLKNEYLKSNEAAEKHFKLPGLP